MLIEENIELAPHTTFRTGGRARFFCCVRNIEDIKKAAIFAQEKKLPIFILGGGSNVLVSDSGFNGLVIKTELFGKSFIRNGDDIFGEIYASENWDEFVGDAVSQGSVGLENLSGIPGTVGGSPVQNIGAYGVEVGDFIHEIEAVDLRNCQLKKFTNLECEFGYRESFFKTEEGRNFLIIKIVFKIPSKGSPNVSYKDLAEYFKGKNVVSLSTQDVREAVLQIRRSKLPDLSKYGTAGSFFKNPIIDKSVADSLKNRFPDLPVYDVATDRSKISLAWVIDKICNLKKISFGRARIFDRQALVIVTDFGATTSEVLGLAKKISDDVKEKIGIEIEFEVRQI
jgi:UDP-N-acetylmuramate dehydrogenase